MIQVGRNNGITGILDLPGQGAQYPVKVLAYAHSLQASTISVAGRGTGDWGEFWPAQVGGQFVVSGQLPIGDFPFPTEFKGETGTLTLTIAGDKIIVASVRVTSWNLTKAEGSQTNPTIEATAQITAMPVLTGFTNDQPTPTAETLTDQETYEGLTKTIDDYDLQDGATQRYALWGVTDTDAAEVTKIQTMIAAAVAPVSNLKLRPAGFQKIATNVSILSFQWARTSTADDVVLPRNVTNVDPQGLGSNASAAAINGVPVAPTGDSFVKRNTNAFKLHDNATLTTYEYGLRTTEQDIEFPGTFTVIDPSDLENVGRQTSVYASTGGATAAADLSSVKLYKIATRIETLNPQFNQVTYEYARQTNAQRVVNQAGYVFTDPSGLESKEIAAAINDSTPTARSALTADRGTRSVYLNADNILYTQELGVRTTEEDITLPNSKYTTGISTDLGIENEEFQVEITNSATPSPNAVNDTGNLTFRSTESYKHSSGKWVHAHRYAPFTAKEDVQEGGTETVNEDTVVTYPLLKEHKSTLVDTNAAASAPAASAVSGLVCTRVSTKKISKTAYSHAYFYEFRSNADKLIAEKNVYRIDQSAIETEIITAAIVAATLGLPPAISVPTAPTVATGTMQLASYVDYPTQNPAYFLRVYNWSLLTNAQKITFGKTTAKSSVTDIYVRETASIDTVADTVTAAAHADNIRGDNYNDATFDEVETTKITPTQILKLMRNSGQDKLILTSGGATTDDAVLGIPESALADPFNITYGETSALVRVARLSAVVVGGPGGATSGLVVPSRIKRTRGIVTVFRRIVTTYANLYGSSNYLHLDACGSVNDDVFCGFPAHTLSYQWPQLEYSRAIADDTAHLALFRYTFLFDSAKHFSDKNFTDGWMAVHNLLSPLTSAGWVDPTVFQHDTAEECEPAWLGEWDYEVFLA